MTQTNPTLDDVWRLFQETDRKFQETDRQMKESAQEASRRFQEADRRFQETERVIKESALETERLMKESALETDRKFKETDQKFKELKDLFTSQWGRLMEALVEGDLVPLLIQHGIPVSDTSTRLKGKCPDGGNYEFDILAHNGIEMVVVEVKTTLRPDDVKHFLYKLDHMKGWIPRYAQNRIYGAVAWLTADAGAEIMAENRGLLSIRATGDSASIVNAATFRPRAW
ncbi:hypothetical protein [Thiorhodospira sibirica]|uniref:hypothetical protein n=1 Tax=Thiorhodospira sibirica TaxID=154347 RepID=UPI00022C04DC|nr:hypothetical protein [Thiorhodospira sibirica]